MACQKSWKLCDVMYIVFIMSLSFYFVKSGRIERLYSKHDYFLGLMVRWAARKVWGWWRVGNTFREEWAGKTSPCPVDQFPQRIEWHVSWMYGQRMNFLWLWTNTWEEATSRRKILFWLEVWGDVVYYDGEGRVAGTSFRSLHLHLGWIGKQRKVKHWD